MIKDLEKSGGPSSSYNSSTITTWTSVEGKDAFFLVWGSNDSSLSLGHFRGPFGETVVLRRYEDPNKKGKTPYKIKYFHQPHFLGLVVAFYGPKETVVGVYGVNGTQFQARQNIPAEVGADIDIYQDRQETFLTIGDSNGVRIFSWKFTQFDQSAIKMMSGVQSVRIMRIASDTYIATFQADPVATSQSELLLYKPENDKRMPKEDAKLQTHQFINTKYNDYRKVSFFRVGASEYLVYVGVEPATIYWWAGDAFLEYQTLKNTANARDVFPLRLVDGEVLLAVLFDSKISFFTQARDHQFIEVYSRQFDAQTVKLTGLHLSTYANKFLYAFLSYESASTSMSPIWKIRLIPYFQPQEGGREDELLSCLNGLGNDIKSRDARLRSLADKASRVWVKDKPQIISAPVIVEGGVHIKGPAEIDSIIITSNASSVPQITARQVKERLLSLQYKVGNVSKDLPNLARKDQSNVIRGKVTFATPVKANRVSIHQISNPEVILNGLPIQNLQNNILTIDGEQVISGRWTFFSGLNAESLYVAGKVNDKSMSDVLLKRSNATQVITGNIFFRNLTIDSRSSLPPTGTVNGIYLEDIVTTKAQGVQVIHGVKTMGTVRVRNDLKVHGLTNGRNLADLAKKAVKLNSGNPQVIRGNIIFRSPHISFNNLHVNGLINNRINLTEMEKYAVSKTKPGQIISGRKTFHGSVSVAGNLDVSGRVNGINFPNDLITLNRPQDILTPLIFKSPVRFAGNVDTINVNGIDLSEEVVLKSSAGPQVIRSRKGFLKGITVKEDITMDPQSTLDSVDPSELAKMITMRNNVTLTGPLIFDNLIINGPVVARQGINGYPISDLPQKVWLKSANQTIGHNVTFLSSIEAASLEVKYLNQMSFPDDFVLKSSDNDQIITGPKTFVNDVSLPYTGLIINKGVKMNGIDIQKFNADIVRNIPTINETLDNIMGVKTFDQIIVKGNIYATKVNGLDLKRDVMINNLRQEVRSPLIFAAPETQIQELLDVDGDINVSGYVNSIKFSEWAKNVVHLASPIERPIRHKKFTNLRAHSVVAAGTINKINLDKFKSQVVTLDSNQVIYGKKRFLGGLFFDGQLKVDLLNGVNITELESRVIRKDYPTRVSGNKIVRGKLIMENSDLEVKGLINNVDLIKLTRDAVYKNRDNVITGHITFASDIRVEDLNVQGKLDGVSVDDLVFLNQNNTIKTGLSFEDDVTIEGQLLIEDGSINGCNLKRLVNESVRLDFASTLIKGKKTFINLDVGRDLNISGPINKINLPRLAEQVVTLDSPQIISGPIVFLDTVTVDNLFIVSNISNVDIGYIMRDAVRKSLPNQEVKGGKVFIQDVVVNGNITSFGNIDVKGFVNGINVTLLEETAVKKHGNQHIHGVKTFAGDVTFENDVTIFGLIGSGQQMIRISEDVVLKNRSGDTVKGETIFRNSTVVRRNLNVGGTIDGVNVVSDFMNKKMSLKRDQTVPGTLEFQGQVSVDRLIVRKTINGIPIQDIVTKTGNHVLKGSYTFVGPVKVSKNLLLDPSATINDISVEDIARRAIDIRRGGHVSGRTVVANAVNLGIHGLKTEKLNGLSVEGVVADFSNSSSVILKKMQDFEDRVSAHESMLNSQLTLLEAHSTTLDFFDVFFEFSKDAEGKHIQMFKFVIIPTNNLYSYGNTSSPYIEFPVADKIVYWKLRGYHVNDQTCPVLGSVIVNHDKTGFTEERNIYDYRNPRHAIFGMKRVDPFYLWLNDSDCSQGRQVLLTDLTHQKNSLHTSPLFAFHFREYSALVDAKGFSSDQEDYVVISLTHKLVPQDKSLTVVFRFIASSNTFVVQQEIRSFAPSSLDVIEVTHAEKKHIFLAVANSLVLGNHFPSVVYFWDTKKKLFQKLQLLDTWSPSSIKFVSTPEATYLLVSNEKAKLYAGECKYSSSFGDTFASYLTQHVNVYQFGRGQFNLVQSLDIPGVTSLEKIHLPPKGVYVIVASKTLGKTFIFNHRGINRFQEIKSFSTPGVIDVKSFWSRDGQLFLAVASDKEGQSKIMKAVLSGPSPRLRKNTPFFSLPHH